MTKHLSHPKYRPDIDGLRAIAVLSVVAFHAFPNWIKGGFIGVDVFFVISGYLISTIIFENLDKGTFSFKEFYSRRIRRIFPALILVLVVSYAIGWFTLFADEYKQLGMHIAGGAGFVSNIILWNESGYFDNAADTKPLLHLWSLGVEEQFYIIYPLLIWLAWKRKFNLLTTTITLAIISLYLNLKGIKHDAVATFYSPLTRFWELMFGSLLAWIILYKKEAFNDAKFFLDKWLAIAIYREPRKYDGKALANFAAFIGLLLLVYGFLRINKELSFPGKWALVPVLGAVLIISAGQQAWANRTILSNRIVVWFGLISFPLYLWHWLLLAFSRILEGEVASPLARVMLILLSILLAWLTYRFVERPVRSGVSKHVSTLLLIVLMIGIGGLGVYTSKENGLQFRSIAIQAVDISNYKDEIAGYKPCDISKLKADGVTLNYCQLSKTASPNSVIIGDSHAADKLYGLVEADKNNSWMIMGNASCPPVLGLSVEGDQKGCEEKFKLILKFIASNKEINNVTLSFFGNYFKTDAYAADHVKNNAGPETVKISMPTESMLSRNEMFFKGLNSAIEFLISNGKNVTVLIDMPELPFFPRDCIRRPFITCEVPRNEVLDRQRELREIISKLKDSNPKLKVYDPINLICSASKCSYKSDDIVIYRDSHHLTLTGSKLYAEYYLSE